MKEQNKLHTSLADKKNSISNIYSMLERQQQTIASLLNKYQDQAPVRFNIKEHLIKGRSQTIEQSELPTSRNLVKRGPNRFSSFSERDDSMNLKNQISARINRSERSESLVLPVVYKRSHKIDRSHKNQIHIKDKLDLSLKLHQSRQKIKLKQDLKKIYGGPSLQYSKVSEAPTKLNPRKKKKKIQSIAPISRVSSPTSQKEVLETRTPEFTPESQDKYEELSPLPEKDLQVESSDESEKQQIPATYYEREFREVIRGQCMQELNFLYFSKNEAMKDWTDMLLSLFEKHDKEISSIRVKSKYLQTFDDRFWTVGIFNTDDF